MLTPLRRYQPVLPNLAVRDRTIHPIWLRVLNTTQAECHHWMLCDNIWPWFASFPHACSTITDSATLPAVAGLELLPQVPPYLPRYASFLFSFLGRGICKSAICESEDSAEILQSTSLLALSLSTIMFYGISQVLSLVSPGLVTAHWSSRLRSSPRPI